MNPELLILRGFNHALNSVGVEAILGSTHHFSQALAPDEWHTSAIGQVGLRDNGARLNWFLVVDDDHGDPLPSLLDNLCLEAGLRRANFIIATSVADDLTFEKLRRSGFCPYSWQQIWQLKTFPEETESQEQFIWLKPSPTDAVEINKLQRKMLSPAVQVVTKIANERLPDYILKVRGRIHGFACTEKFGSKLMATPVISPACDNPILMISGLIRQNFADLSKFYIRQSSDSSWLTVHLEQFADAITARGELLVKHFAVREKARALETNHSTNGRHADPVTPFMHTRAEKDNL